MTNVIEIASLISTDIRTRANAEIIKSAIDGMEGNIILDFKNVMFMSRSFADEVYNILQLNGNVVVSGMSQPVQNMFGAVSASRKNGRVFKNEDYEMREFDDMKSLSTFLATM